MNGDGHDPTARATILYQEGMRLLDLMIEQIMSIQKMLHPVRDKEQRAFCDQLIAEAEKVKHVVTDDFIRRIGMPEDSDFV